MSKLDRLYKDLIKNSSWLFAGKSAGSAFSAIQEIIVARILGLAQYGLLSLVLAFVDILNNFVDLRVWEAATKYVGEFWSKGDKEKTCSMIKFFYLIDIITGIIAFGVAIILAEVASQYIIKSDVATKLIYIYAITLLIDTSNSTSNAILRIFNKFKQIALISSVQNFIRLVLVSVLLVLGKGIEGVLLAFVISSFIGFFIRIIYVNQTLISNNLNYWWVRKTFVKDVDYKDVSWFLLNTSFAGSLKALKDRYAGVLILGFFAGKEAAGIYKVARSTVKILSRITDPIYEAIYPELVKIYSLSDLDNFEALLKKSSIGISKVLLPLTILIIVFAEYILKYVYGQEYVLATNVLRLVAISVVISKLVSFAHPAFLALGRPGVRTVVQTISIITYIVLLLILVPVYSYMGAAYSLLGYAIVFVSLTIYWLNILLAKEKNLRTDNI
ncbi:MAG: oligosaccharide flippase family protein [Candidatus Dadabacteria bacterium]|nr:oligosaccharide flippase family protein [Candidatus Dadabacteria bacterium]NIQ14430.1 oligosaccharide flippase family protein [Candidatus Dadabacteria bacterium]